MYKKKGQINDVYNLAYNFLRTAKILHVSQEEVNRALEEGTKRANQINPVEQPFLRISKDPENEQKRWARNWCVENFFSKHELKDILSKINPSQFQ